MNKVRLCCMLMASVVVACSSSSDPDEEAPGTSAADTDTADVLEPTVAFSWDTGGSVQTNLGYGIVVNPKSSMKRVWITANDSTFPARLLGTAGIRSAYSSERYSGNYEYRTTVEVEPLETLSAIEIRFPVFDVWGQLDKTLSMTEVIDMEPGQTYSFSPRWRVLSENEVSEFWASMAFISRVRTKDGQVVEFPLEPILEEARRFSNSVELEDLSLDEGGPDSANVAVP